MRSVETKRNVFPVVSVFSELDLGFGLNVEIIKKLHAGGIFEYLANLKSGRNQL